MLFLFSLLSAAQSWDLQYGDGCYWYGDYYCNEYYSYSYECKSHGREGYGTYSCPDDFSLRGDFYRDSPNEGTITWEQVNRSYTGGWYDWKFSGEGTFTDNDGTTLYSDGWYGAGTDYCGKVNCDFGNACLLTYVDGKTFKGDVEVQQYCRFSSGTILSPKEGSGTVKYDSFSNLPKPGSGQISSIGKLVYTGTIKGGYPEGQGKIKATDLDYEYSGGSVSVESGFHYQGQGTLKYNEATYEGGWKDDKTHGTGIFTDSRGCVRTGEWKGGIDVGDATLTCPDGLDFKGKTNYVAEEETYRPFEGAGIKFINGDKYYFVSSNGTEIKTNKLGMTYSVLQYLEDESGADFFKSMKESVRGCSVISLTNHGWLAFFTSLIVLVRRSKE